MEKPCKEIHTNAVKIKSKNKSVEVGDLNNETYLLIFKIVDGSLKPRAIHEVLKDKAVKTVLRLSKESLEYLHVAITDILNEKHKQQ